MRFGMVAAAVLLCACTSDERLVEVAPGVGIGPVRVAMTYDALVDALGELQSQSIQSRIAMGRYPELGVEVVLSTASNLEITPDAVVLAVGVRAADGVRHDGMPHPGQGRAEIEAAFGAAPEVFGAIHYYPEGFSIEYEEGDRMDVAAIAVGVFATYQLTPAPPPMTRAGDR